MLKTFTLAAMMGAATAATAATTGGACRVTSPAQTQVLVELYTSQGCSSCPPADRWLSQLDLAATPGVVPLSLHVGYWDYIGWKDPYARREFNERQRWLADLNRNRTVYTPGVFVQGRETPRWYEASALRATAATPARATIELSAELAGTGVKVNVDARPAAGVKVADAKVFVALTASGLETKVKAGENRGATLRNDHVARDWSGPLAPGAHALSFEAPAAAADAPLAIVAFVQDTKSGEVLQAVRLPVAACGR